MSIIIFDVFTIYFKSINIRENMNFELYDNNRSTRIFNLINSTKTIDYDRFKEIKLYES